MNTDLNYQAYDLQIRPIDPYGGTKYKILFKLLENSTSQKILNIGSGYGELSIRLAKIGHQVTSIEPEHEFYKHGLNESKKLGLTNCKFLPTTLENYITKDRFDLVIAIDVIEHIKIDTDAFEKIAQLLDVEGKCFITVPALPWLSGNHDEKLHHYRRYTKESLKKVIGPYLKVTTLRYFGFTLIPIAILYSKILKKYYPISQSSPIIKEGLLSKLLRLVLRFDSMLPFCIGTSLILVAKKADNTI